MQSISVKLIFLSLSFLLLPIFCSANESFPSFPMAFWGNAAVDDEPLPAGTIIKAYCNNNLIGEITMSEDRIYGYTEATKNKLLVSNCDNDILFKYLPQGGNEDLIGGVEIKYTEGFVLGTTIIKDLNFINTRSCSITNGTGVQTWDGNNWGDCIVVSCNNGYHQSGNRCVADSSGGGSAGGGGGGGPSTPSTPETTTGEVIVTASAGGKTTALSSENTKAVVEIPADAVNNSTEIKIVPVIKSTVQVATKEIPIGKSVIGNYVYNFTAVSGGKAVVTFSKPIILTFTYTDEQVKRFNELSLKIHYWREDDSKWVDLDTEVDAKNNILTASVEHFTLFAIMGTKGDMNGDGKINFDDFVAFALLYKKTYTNSDKKVEDIPISWGDFDSDGDVDFDDFAIFALSYGK